MSDQQQQVELFQKAIDNPSVANLNKRQRALAEDVISRALSSPVSVRTVIDEARTNLLDNEVFGENRETAMAILVSLERSQTDSVTEAAPDGLRIIDPATSGPVDYDTQRASLVAAAEEARDKGNPHSSKRIMGLIVDLDARHQREENDPEFQAAKTEAEQAEAERIQGFMDQSAELAERASRVDSGEFVTYEEDKAAGKAPTQFQRQR